VRNLTRPEATERAATIEVVGYDVTLDLTGGDRTFRAISTISFVCTGPSRSTFIELAAADVHSATLNGDDVDISPWSPETGLALTGLGTDNVLIVDADFAYSTSGQGLHRAVDPADGEVYLFSQFEINDAQRMYACFDQPDLKAEFTFHVTAPEHWTVVSNMPVEWHDGNTRHFQRSPRMSTYVTALCAGPFHSVRAEHDGIDLGLFVRASAKEHLDADAVLAVTRQGFDFFHEQFGLRYPLPKFDQVWAIEYNGAAMENFGCVTLSEELFLFRGPVTDFEHEKRANHILHELAHMWFGNLVTMRWWDDIWLKEAFAEWASHWCAGAWTTFLSVRKNWAYRADQLSSTHPVSSEMPDVEAVEANFDGITYAKGASVIKQLVAYVGQDTFLTGLRTYLMRHAYGNATFDDLLTDLEDASALSLRDYADSWLRTSSVNTLRPLLTVDGDRYTTVAVEQTAPAAHPTLRTHRIAIGLYDSSLRRTSRVEVTVQGPSTPVPLLTGQPVADVVLVNDDDLTYAKLRFDPRSLATVLARLPEFESSLVRGLCWAAAWDMTRDAALPAREYVRLVCTALPLEDDVNLVTATLGTSEPASAKLGQVRVVLDQYADPSWAPVGRQMLADAARSSRSSPVWSHAFLTAARSPDDLATLREWLAGSTDPELRWNVLGALIALGAADPAEIEEELARDRTAAGERAAATARALIPTEAAKASTWRRLTTEPLPNWEQRALLFGFHHPAQVELTSPYAEAYFDVLTGFWAGHDNQNAQQFAIYAYPALHVAQSTVDASDAFLSVEDHPAPLRRLVEDGRDGIVRALAARATDAG